MEETRQNDKTPAEAPETRDEQAEDVSPDAEALMQRLESAESEVEKYRDLLLRAKAEAENTAKRTSREMEKVRKYANEGIFIRLFEVKDNLERSLQDENTQTSAENLKKGVELTLKSLIQVFSDHQVEEIDPNGKAFDPELHQAVSAVETDTVSPQTVIEVLQKGYRLKERLLRPAMVIVAAAKSGDVDKTEENPPSDN